MPMARKRKRKLKVGNLVFSILIVLLIITGIRYKVNTRPVSKDTTKQEFVVETGANGKDICHALKKADLVHDESLSYLYVKVNHLNGFKQGIYELSPSMSLAEILTTLNDANAAQQDVVTIVIYPGDWAKHIAKTISTYTNVSQEELMDLWNDHEWISSIMDQYPFLTNDIFKDNVRCCLEGYLAPNTYQVFKETTAKDVTLKLLDETKRIYDIYQSEIESSSMSVTDIFTLASIVQYEAGNEKDMRMIAGVFENRLAIDMPLQSSVTVCYALDINRGDDWTKCEVNPTFESPYNTYKYKGLPPGPILNPGELAIDAVLHPTKSDYLFFMADVYGDGTVYYSKTYEEHQALVRKYLQ